MLKQITLLIILIFSGSLFASTYYISSSRGNDAFSGLSPDSCWQSLDKVNTFIFQPGDSILFQCGDIWRGQLLPQSGSEGKPIVYGSFGEGEKPALLGSQVLNDLDDWEMIETNIWQSTTTFVYDVGNIIFNHEESCGVKKWTQSDLQTQGDFYYDRSSQHLLLFSSENPAHYYETLECALTRNIIQNENVSYIVYENLAVRYGGAHGIGGGNTAHVQVRNCDFCWLGGGELFANIRYGNGVEFWGNAHDNLVEYCRFWQIYDAAMTNQNNTETAHQSNITYRYNQVWDCEQSFEFWCQPETSTMEHIYFENNTCVRAGNGWSHAQRPEAAGRHIMSYTNTAVTNDIVIRNNILYQATESCVWISDEFDGLEALHFDYNCYYQPDGDMIYFHGTSYTMDAFPNYVADTGQDSHSLATDPLFVNPLANDFHLQQNSPCIDAGDPASPSDADGTRNDMGALYFDQSASLSGNNRNLAQLSFHLQQNFPNPFNPVTVITYVIKGLPVATVHVKLTVYNVQGQKVQTLVEAKQKAGHYAVSFKANHLASGVYFYRLSTSTGFVQTRKMILLR